MKRKVKTTIPLVLLVIWFFPEGVEAHFVPGDPDHQSLSHIIETEGLRGCLSIVQTFGDLARGLGITEESCREAARGTAEAVREGEEAFEEMGEAVRETGEAAIETIEDIASRCFNPDGTPKDPVTCASALAEMMGEGIEAGMSELEGIMTFAELRGNITMETGGGLTSLVGTTTIGITNIVYEDVSDACRNFVEAWRLASNITQIATLTTGGPYSILVPACGRITYTIAPTNPLFSWDPPTRSVTVGGGGGTTDTTRGGPSGTPVKKDVGYQLQQPLFQQQQEDQTTTTPSLQQVEEVESLMPMPQPQDQPEDEGDVLEEGLQWAPVIRK